GRRWHTRCYRDWSSDVCSSDLENDEQRIAVMPLSGGKLRAVSPADRYVYEYDWLPDGSGFVTTSAPGNGDNNWWVASLDRIDLRSEERRVGKGRRSTEAVRHCV